MSLLDLLGLALRSLASNRKRTALSLVGMSIGVAAVLLLTCLGEGARGFVLGQFQLLGSNVIGVLPGRTETSGALPGVGGAAHDLTLADAEAILRGVPQAAVVAPVAMGNESVAHGELRRRCLIIGATREFMALRRIQVRGGGRFLPDRPWDRGGQEAVIGSKLAVELFPGENPLGRTLRVGGWRMRVVGVVEPRGVQMGVDMDETLLAPVATVMRMFDRTTLFRIAVQVRSETEIDSAQRRITALLSERHGEQDFTLLTEDAVVGALGSILDVLTLGLAGIAAISLSVAGLGIMNVMLVTVSERQGEVGLLKALGAAPRQILAVFLAEAALLAAAGGSLGLVVGLALSRLLGLLVPALRASPPLWAELAALGLALAVGLVFGVLPARKAMRLDPVRALAGS